MFCNIVATALAWTADVKSSTERLVMLSLAKHANEELMSFPSVDTICSDTLLNRKTVYACLSSLDGRLIRKSKSKNNSNTYVLLLSSSSAKNGSTEIGSTNIGSTENGSTKNGTTYASSSTEIGTTETVSSTEIGTTVVPKTVQPLSQNWDTNIYINNNMVTEDDINDMFTEAASESNSVSVNTKPSQRKKTKPVVVYAEKPDCITQDAWDEWIAVRKKKGADKPTPRAMKLLENQCKLAGWEIKDAIDKCILRNWISFEASYVSNEPKPKQQKKNPFV